MSTVGDQVSKLLIAHFGMSVNELRPDVKFEELDLDSLALVEFAMLATKEFGVEIGEDEITPHMTISDSVRIISSKRVGV